MPNCDFYALRDDAISILNFALNEAGCNVYELYSPPGQELRCFRSVAELLEAYDVGAIREVHLQLYAPSMRGLFRIERIDLDPDRFPSNPWRYKGHGWGAIQLYCGGLVDGQIYSSHTNHNSLKRALAWEEALGRDLGRVDAWNWSEVSKISSRINRFIRRTAISKIGSRPVLSAAFEAFSSGRAALNPPL